ncbi:hypothetical protein AAEX63_05050 [Luteococcus sp. H138]|uniref:hypothetical protein n=1 Tax=unclassified Luteococcus TaxID=2639923 RepID=UPI00313EA1F1
MTAFLISLVLILLVSLAVVAVVVVGMKGALRERAPKLHEGLAETARHMNGEGEAPQMLVDLLPQQLVASPKH